MVSTPQGRRYTPYMLYPSLNILPYPPPETKEWCSTATTPLSRRRELPQIKEIYSS